MKTQSPRPRCQGFGLMEAVLAIALGLGILLTGLAMTRTGQHKADAGRVVADATRIIGEVRRLYSTTSQAGYTGLTGATLRAAGADLEDLWVPASSTYRVGTGLATIAASDRVPGGTASAGDGFSVAITGVKPEACQAAISALGGDAAYISAANTAGVAIEVTGVPGTPTPATVQSACNRLPAVTLTMHYN